MRIAVVSFVLLATSPALARPGFYVGLAGGGSGVSGQSGMGSSAFGPDEFGLPLVVADGFGFSTENDGSPATLVRLGFNVLGYAAVELVTSGQGKSLTDEDLRQWAAHAHLGARVYPLWHWQHLLPPALQPLEPSFFLGWGVSYQVYTPVPGLDPVGWEDWGSLRWGLGAEYFVIEYFKLTAEWTQVRARYDTFIYNQEEGIRFPVLEPQTTSYNQFLAGFAFQFGATQRTVTYVPHQAEEEAAPAQAPAAPPPVHQPAPEIIDG